MPISDRSVLALDGTGREREHYGSLTSVARVTRSTNRPNDNMESIGRRLSRWPSSIPGEGRGGMDTQPSLFSCI